MDITCENCQSKFRIADDKIPPGKTATLNCPKCKNKISVTAEAAAPEPGDTEETAYNGVDSGDYDASEKPFDFVEEEGRTALVCESVADNKKALTAALDLMEYHITEAENVRDALTKMRYHNYDLVLLNEHFDSTNPDENGVLVFLERQPMSVRRDTFVALISSRFRTMDNMMAFNKSVNVILNTESIADTEKILKRAIADNDLFYRVYRDALKESGRA
jgi:predicted Zn finger-like uncharacterized protein